MHANIYEECMLLFHEKESFKNPSSIVSDFVSIQRRYEEIENLYDRKTPTDGVA